MSPLFYIKECFSTNDEVLSYLSEEEIVASYSFNQTNGRGQYGNVWKSAPNQNLAYSLAIKCSKIRYSDIFLNYYTAIIIRDFIANMTQSNVFIKWPNDIILINKKVCGFLIEKRKVNNNYYYIIGIGINILQTDFSLLPKAGSILSVCGMNIDLAAFVNQFHNYLINRIINIVNDNEILIDYNKNLFRKDRISVFNKNGNRQNGIIKNADKEGFIWIDLEEEGLKKFFHKEIELLY